VKARAVEGLDGAAPLAANVARILEVRIAELRSFVPQAFDAGEVEALHDLRIAAKRLRYVLELTGEACVGAPAAPAIALVKELQGVLGDVHDSDELAVRLDAIAAPAPGVDVLAARLRERRAARFARFLELWPAVEAAATSCSHRGNGDALPS
jgi:CHAD domain-containing protein